MAKSLKVVFLGGVGEIGKNMTAHNINNNFRRTSFGKVVKSSIPRRRRRNRQKYDRSGIR
nr:MAG TPA: Metal dependent hydrolase [Caudoviricetes sp.]